MVEATNFISGVQLAHNIMQNKNVKLRPVHVRRESNQCLAIRNATHWADTRSRERISCI